MKKITIIAIVGASGSGKTTLGRHMCDKLGYNWICSYTTRPIREDEINGVDHLFVSDKEKPSADDMIAYGVFGGYEYWAEYTQFSSVVPNVYIIDEDSLLKMRDNLKSKYGDLYEFITVYVKGSESFVLDVNRIKRDENRTTLPEDYYDVVIENNGDLDSFLEKGVEIVFQLRLINTEFKLKNR